MSQYTPQMNNTYKRVRKRQTITGKPNVGVLKSIALYEVAEYISEYEKEKGLLYVTDMAIMYREKLKN